MKTRGQLKKQQGSTILNDSQPVHHKKTKKQLLEEKNRRNGAINDHESVSKKKNKVDDVPLRRSKRQSSKPIRVSDNEKSKAQQQPAKDQRAKRTASREQVKMKKKQAQLPRPRKKANKQQQQIKKGQRQKEQKNSAKVDSKQDQQDAKQQIKTIQFKGRVPIDDHCSLKGGNCFVLQQGGKIYSCTLNQTSVSNNNNKFYILQVIQREGKPTECYFFTRWGRVGVTGQQSQVGPYPPHVAVGMYNSKYHQKHVKGDYREVQLNYEEQKVKDNTDDKKDDNQQKQKKKEKKDFDQSKLASPVKKLIELIFDLNMMNNHMIQIGYNVKRMPLGRLSKQNILKGFNMLKQLMQEINGKKNPNRIEELTNDFYSYIPHDFGFNKMRNFILDTEKKVKDKIQMLQSLNEIKVATSLIGGGKNEEFENKIDSNYKKLNRDIQSIEKNTEEFQIMNKYLKSTHAQTHTSYELELVDLFALSSDMQNEKYKKDINNKMLLWHGSRLTNFVGILSQGLRIAPPQAPVTGYMFGKGVYFADMSSKSANYCFTSRENNTGILLLCQVALGQMNEKLHADYYASNLPPGKLSTKGLGRNAPNPENAIKIQGDITVPLGPGINTNIPGCSLLYNEFIVYDIAQIRVRYLLRTKFNYKKFH